MPKILYNLNGTEDATIVMMMMMMMMMMMKWVVWLNRKTKQLILLGNEYKLFIPCAIYG